MSGSETYLSMGDFAALLCGSLGDLGVAVAEVADADAGGHVEQLDALVRGDPRALAVLEDMLGEAADALGDVRLAERGGVKASSRHGRSESGLTGRSRGERAMRGWWEGDGGSCWGRSTTQRALYRLGGSKNSTHLDSGWVCW